jgi:hypothetical protein
MQMFDNSNKLVYCRSHFNKYPSILISLPDPDLLGSITFGHPFGQNKYSINIFKQ